MIDQIFNTALEKYGITAAVVLYIAKTLFDLFSGNLLHYIKAIDANTAAVNKLSKDLQTAFFNIKELRDKTAMGPISKPSEVDQ